MNSRKPLRGALMAALLMLYDHVVAGENVTPTDPDTYMRGAKVYERCAACHALATDRTGPRHCGIIGRRAGSVPGFPYSPAMRRSKIVWTEKSLDRFLKSPLAVVPGTAMGYDGVKNGRERHDLIGYLRAASLEPKCQALHPNEVQRVK